MPLRSVNLAEIIKSARIEIFLAGDRIRHNKTGEELIVSHVLLTRQGLKIETTMGQIIRADLVSKL